MTGERSAPDGSAPLAVPFEEATGYDPALLGSKAATLVRLAAADFPVPPGIVVTTAADGRRSAAASLVREWAADRGADRFAVRSSAAAEDLADASYAGQYETVLDVEAGGLGDAIERVADSAAAERVAAYEDARGVGAPGAGDAIAVIVQTMVDADASGVAFTANPLTGARDEAVVSAVAGAGERLVSGAATGEHWVVRDGTATRRRPGDAAISARQAVGIAGLAREVEEALGGPQDVEWAIADGTRYLLQARPMTGLPDPVEWELPGDGWWHRNLRLGEWLPEPVTPLCADWLVPRIESGFAAASADVLGVPREPDSAILNGWYYTAAGSATGARTAVAHLARDPAAILRLKRFLIDPLRRPERAADALAAATAEWREEFRPRYRETVEAAAEDLAGADPARVAELVDEVSRAGGRALFWLSLVGGAAWKIERALRRFHRENLAASVDAGPEVLVSGLPGIDRDTPEHAVYSADWYWPTAGERDGPSTDAGTPDPDDAPAERRRAAEASCRAALEGRPTKRRRFDRLLDLARTYAVVREQQARSVTLGWPVLRRCALRLGTRLRDAGAVDGTEDVFFLERSELGLDGSGTPGTDRRAVVARRRETWERQRSLRAPLELGEPSRLERLVFGETLGDPGTDSARPEGTVSGQPASPGRASGPARIIVDPDEFDRFEAGDVLVARSTTPAWTPLFDRAAAVVTDGGSLAAHASLVAREYDIPAVVGTGDATHALQDGQEITVDGSAGVVR